jgi:hypothetical protein
LKQHRDRTNSTDFRNEWLLVFSEKLRNGRQSVNKYARHLIALKIAHGEDKRPNARLHERCSLNIPVSDAMVFGKDHPPFLPNMG